MMNVTGNQEKSRLRWFNCSAFGISSDDSKLIIRCVRCLGSWLLRTCNPVTHSSLIHISTLHLTFVLVPPLLLDIFNEYYHHIFVGGS